MIGSFFAITRVLYVFSWGDIATEINNSIRKIEQTIESNHQTLEIKDIKLNGGSLADGMIVNALIIYEIKEIQTNKGSL